jgi:DnaJ-class molecular chaperone
VPDGELYSLLGVSRSATAIEIKRAYRRLAKLLHPDRNQADSEVEDRFRRVAHAYGVLSDARKRKIYDRCGEEGLGGAGAPRSGSEATAEPTVGGRRRASSGPAANVGQVTARELFGPSGGPAPRQGANLSCVASLDLAEAVRGCVREVRIKGTNASPDRRVRVRIPAGVVGGERLRVRGLGRAGSRGGEPGDLFIVTRIRPHPYFFLEDGELHVHLPLTPLEAYDGAEIEVPTPHGPVQVRVPRRSQAGAQLRVRSRGIARGQSAPGDLRVHLRVVLPTVEGVREVYAKLDEALVGAVREDLRFD